jgi:serine/threonine protein phosphatase 1
MRKQKHMKPSLMHRAKETIVAIGDIHGMKDVLNLLLGHLEKEFSPAHTKFVFLGDVVDRGPDSVAAVAQVAQVIDQYPDSTLILGNHDYYLRSFLRGEIAYEQEVGWLQMGGAATLGSYGVDRAMCGSGKLFQAGKIVSAAYPDHLALLEKAVFSFETENHFFTHAGVDPQEPLANQLEHDLMWIRGEFLDHMEPFEKMIVHGHTITETWLPEVRSNRIALDTGRTLLAAFQLPSSVKTSLQDSSSPRSKTMRERSVPSMQGWRR